MFLKMRLEILINKTKSRIDLVLFFLLSYIVSFYYINSDQFHYLKNYQDIKNVDLLSAFNSYRGNLSSSEPIYFLFSFYFQMLEYQKFYFVQC